MSGSSGERPRLEARPVAPDDLQILVVDDDEDAADLMALYLRSLGHAVRVAHDGPSALEHRSVRKTDHFDRLARGDRHRVGGHDRLGFADRIVAVRGGDHERTALESVG